MLFTVSPSIGLPALAGLVLGESAGLPIPGETALIVAGGLASTGQMSLPLVIAVAAISAMVGDMIGYWVGRRGGRKLLLRPGRFSAHRHAAVEKADRYFARYGLVTVFFARFVPGVRVVGAVAAGTTQMRFRSFAIANALGCWAWATTVGTIAYLVGTKGALVMVVVGFGIAGIGMLSAIVKTRRDNAAETASLDGKPAHRSPLEDLAAYAESIPTPQLPPVEADTSTPARSGSANQHTAPAHGSVPSGAASAITLAPCINRLP